MDQRSKCKAGWLHRYMITKSFPEGVEERCEICKDRKFFKHNTPNYIYIAYHMRSALPRFHSRFNREYKS